MKIPILAVVVFSHLGNKMAGKQKNKDLGPIYH